MNMNVTQNGGVALHHPFLFGDFLSKNHPAGDPPWPSAKPRPLRGPAMAAPTNAATPPVMWAMPLPAKSMKPRPGVHGEGPGTSGGISIAMGVPHSIDGFFEGK